MSSVPSTSTPHSNFVSIFNAALESYKRKTKKDLASHPFLPHFQSCDSLQRTQFSRALAFSSWLVSFIAAKDASASQDKLIELFNRIERFFRRLEIYTGITPTTAMTDIVIEIMVEVLTILAIATKEAKGGQLTCLEKYLKKLTGNTEIEDSLSRLDNLTQEEARMASAELLKMTHSVDGKVMGVDNRVKGVEGKVSTTGYKPLAVM
ncbi:hypothetical protein DFH94DRAFT_841583 [Russula ochroleuca]|uniref:Fungal STAND N-terminal Goodbye domain-containing protein n=1 Tax=Russula ochroleuca TaxID=152965 RepID=A0A9P5N619_9AGAM|nr:hypothetical protein DFH94DRAFT_841583 [Russula ochroleuca]